MNPIDQRLARFGEFTVSFVCQVLRADWGCFYHIDRHGQPFGFRAHRTPTALRDAYRDHNMQECDPLHPLNLAGQDLRFIPLLDPRLSCLAEARRSYWSFLRSFGARDAAEMVFRSGGRALAGLSLIWTARADAGAERERGEAVQSYVEFNLASHYAPLFSDGVCDGAARHPLTDRERQIVDLVCAGATNAQIAHRLSIGLATVKTHLIHIFEKCAVRTRAALVTQVLAGRSGLNA